MLNNTSSTNPKIDINVFIDDEKIIADTFNYTDIRPNEIPFPRSFPKGRHNLLIESHNSKLIKDTMFILDDTLLNIFVSYGYHYPDSAEIKGYQYENFLIKGDSLKGFDTSKYIVKEQVSIHFMKGKIVPR